MNYYQRMSIFRMKLQYNILITLTEAEVIKKGGTMELYKKDLNGTDITEMV